jgi:O-methyltransferase
MSSPDASLKWFEGLPEPGEHDLHKAGEFALKPNEYEFMKSHFRDKHSNVEILKGYSPEVFNEIPEDKVFSFVHVDVDLYDSVNDALDYFWPRLVDGGMMLFDDYGFDTTPGAKKAIDEWDHACMYRGELFFANYIFCGQYLIIK